MADNEKVEKKIGTIFKLKLSMSVEKIVSRLNKLSDDYNIGGLQSLRKEIKGLSKVPTYDIFNGSTTGDNGEWGISRWRSKGDTI